MKQTPLWIVALILLALPTKAQDWQPGATGNVEYNCEAVQGIIAAAGDEFYLIAGADTLTPGDGTAEHYVISGIDVLTVAESLLGRAAGCGDAPAATEGVVDIYTPQAWKHNITREYLYQCEVVRDIVAAVGQLELRRDGNRRHTVISYYQEDAPACMPRYVIAREHQRVQECAGSDCAVLTGFLRGEALPVVGWSEGWFEVALEAGSGYVAQAKVAPGPYGFLQTGKQHSLEYADCIIIPQRRPKDYSYITIIKSGSAYQEIDVALYQPLSDTPLGIYSEEEKVFSNDGTPFTLQIPGPVADFPKGIYTVQLTWGDLTFNYGFALQEPDVYDIHVYCDRPASE